MTPHPQRCETCKHYTDGKYFDLCLGIVMEPIGVFDWVKVYGCASHSIPQPEKKLVQCLCEMCRMTVLQCIGLKQSERESEREKVLDDFTKLINYDNRKRYAKTVIIRMIDSLRSNKQEQQG